MGKIICLAERSDTWHVESRFGGRFFSAHGETDDVRFRDTVEHQDSPNGYWEIIAVPELVTPEIEEWAESICKCKYDYFGAWNSVIGVPLRDPYRYDCAFVAEAIASRSGIEGLDPMPSPARLRQQLRDRLRLTSLPNSPLLAGLAIGDDEVAYLNDLVARGRIGPETAQAVLAACPAV
jgi:hypothetical protein